MAESNLGFMDGLEARGMELRLGLLGLQEGVIGTNDLKPTLNGATVDVAAGQACVQGDYASFQGLYGIINDATKNTNAFEGGGLPAPAANPAVHQIVAKVYDPVYEAGEVGRWRLRVVPGVPTAGAQINDPTAAGYRAGAVDINAGAWRSSMRIADVHQATNGTLTLRDRRPFAKTGVLLAETILTSNAVVTVNSGAFASMGGTSTYFEAGNDHEVRAEWWGAVWNDTATRGTVLRLSSLLETTGMSTADPVRFDSAIASQVVAGKLTEWQWKPTAGRQNVIGQWKTTGVGISSYRGADINFAAMRVFNA